MTETKIDEQVKASEFLPKGYTGDIRKDRCKGGGGVIITEKFRNNPQCTIILGEDFNAGDIDWESHTVCEHSLNRQVNEKILSVISSSGLVQIQKDFTRNDKILDLLCTNKPDLFSDIRSIPGISDHEIILADCDLKPVVCKKPPRTIYLWNKVDWNKIFF